MKEYNKKNIPLARALRRNMTPWERKLWYQYLSKYPIRFQRQKAIGDYIADFYCAKAKMVIELDGGGHYEEGQAKADGLRTACLERMNLRVIRICNADIDKNFRGVCELIDHIVRDSLPQSASLTAPSSEGACPHPAANWRIVALGFFDGVHLGHQALLRECVRMARQYGYVPAAITFDRHPQSLFTPTPPALINSNADREALLRRYGIEHIYTVAVNQASMNMDRWDFLEDLLADGAHGFVCGYDFRFGRKGMGDAQSVVDFCTNREMLVDVIPEQILESVRISSTHIRSLIEHGNMEEATKFLGHPHILSGEVVAGRQLGRTIGVPTANILIPEDVVVPRRGVYACICHVGEKKYLAVTNIGSRPTVGGHQTRAESWILDFEGDLYGKKITLEFHKFLRPEQKFADLDALKAQIQQDAAETRNVLR